MIWINSQTVCSCMVSAMEGNKILVDIPYMVFTVNFGIFPHNSWKCRYTNNQLIKHNKTTK